VWRWAKGHLSRWVQALHWARRRAKDDPKFEKPKKVYGRKVRKGRKRKHDDQGGWPKSMHITELFNNDNGLHNHVHVASTDRDALIALGNIAVKQYGGAGAVREFPPFDPVECVHVSTSWHYRDSSSPYTLRTCANRGDGCAMDLGFARRQEFGDEIKRRYGADACDF
jgi:hypothetical protein